jgi:hypothetical protein
VQGDFLLWYLYICLQSILIGFAPPSFSLIPLSLFLVQFQQVSLFCFYIHTLSTSTNSPSFTLFIYPPTGTSHPNRTCFPSCPSFFLSIHWLGNGVLPWYFTHVYMYFNQINLSIYIYICIYSIYIHDGIYIYIYTYLLGLASTYEGKHVTFYLLSLTYFA